jgi:hypothetical protein
VQLTHSRSIFESGVRSMDIDRLTKQWNVLVVFATSICTCIAGFLVLPPLGFDEQTYVKFGVFAVTLILGLWLIPVRIASRRNALRRWGWLGVVLVAASICAFLAYNGVLDAWTFEYAGTREVAGSRLSSAAETTKVNLENQGRVATNHDLLWEFGGDLSMVWPDIRERTRRTDILLNFYLAQLLLFASAIVCVVQASYCAALPEDSKET